jgi:hypothetical protein
MGWERRKGSSYYYRKERSGGRVKSVYVGTGLIASLGADLDTREKAKKDAEREAFRHEVERQNVIDSQIDEVCRMTEMLTRAALIASGFHLHRGQWRRRRNGKEES